MQIIHPTRQEGLLGLRAMHMVAGADGEIGPAASALMLAAQKVILDLDAPPNELAPITPPELAAGMSSMALAEQLCQGMIVVSFADGPATPTAWAQITAFAEAMKVELPALRTIRKLIEHHMLIFRLDFLRHSHLLDVFKNQFRYHGGIRGLAEAVLGISGLRADPKLAARFTAFEDFPEGSLGRHFFRHYRENGFAFPGEKTGFPVAGVYHDFAHVLGGYGTTPAEEMLVAGMTAGFRQSNPFYVLLFAHLTFGAGINMTPLSQPMTTGTLSEPGVAERFLHAIERGAAMNTDLSDNWDFWPYVERPIDDVREALGLQPEKRF